jgi:hypothetical protein
MFSLFFQHASTILTHAREIIIISIMFKKELLPGMGGQ